MHFNFLSFVIGPKLFNKLLFKNTSKSGLRYFHKTYLHQLNIVPNGISRNLVYHMIYRENIEYFTSLRYMSYEINNTKIGNFLRALGQNNFQATFNQHVDPDIFELLKEKETLEDNIQQLLEMKKNEGNNIDGTELVKLIEDDILQYITKLNIVYQKLLEYLIPSEEFENCNDVVLEISAGIGGSEAMLFTSELRDMYCGFLNFKGWQYHIAENYESELGGVRQCSLLVSGAGAYMTMRHEAGVHRVQRVPTTDKGGRMHTSTATVAVLPQPSDVEVLLKDSDLKIETKKASGAGGQHVNTTDSAVRVTHIPTGIVVECQMDRSQHQNKTTALKRLQSKIFEKELTQQNTNIKNQRKLQVGTSARSEKIRTYNYRDDRISDHRLTENFHNLKQFLEGGEPLDILLCKVEKWHYNQRVLQFLNDLPS